MAKQQKQVAKNTQQPVTKGFTFPNWHPAVAYGIGFALLWVFCTVIYGDVFEHIASENYFSFDRESMAYVLHRDYGTLLWAGRFLLLTFKSKWVGGTLMAFFLTLTARHFDAPWLYQQRWRGIGFLPALAALAYIVQRGFNLFLRNEPSTFVLIAAGLFVVSALYAAVMRFAKPRTQRVRKGGVPAGLAASAMLFCAVAYGAIVPNENVRLSCRMQNQMEDEDWSAMIETARSAKQPSRTIAALHAVALTQTNQLLEGMFDIFYDFPTLDLEYVGGNDEGINFNADCNLHAGLVNSAYRSSMESTVVIGPRLQNFKRMAICTILNGEQKLGERYFHLIAQMPGESAFVERYRPMLTDTTLIAKDPTLACIKALHPMERKFEQNYRQPAFLGYNVGLLQGTDATLVTSLASCLYSKDLDNMLMRANVLRQKRQLPLPVLQAIAIASIKREGLLKHFPEVNDMVMQELQSFVTEAAPYIEAQMKMSEEEKIASKREMAAALRDNWLGSYMYYYYCGNYSSQQEQEKGSGVN